MTTSNKNKKKLFIQTHGCQMNDYDSLRIKDLLCQGEEISTVDDPKDADILILNTCSIREKAQDKVFHQLGRWRKLKEKNKNLVIGVGGCVASQEGLELKKRAPYIDLIFGPQSLHRIPELIAQQKSNHKTAIDISFPENEKFDILPQPIAQGPIASIAIMEGCNKYCSFCVVPYTRGEEISRPMADILREVKQLCLQGVKEITFLGQNVNAYLGHNSLNETVNFAELLFETSLISGLERLRYTTSHPLDFSDDLIEVYKEIPQLVNHVHLPVQSGSNTILTAMKRNHTIEYYEEQITKLKSIRPNISISSDFIVGFPGETSQHFQATMNLIERIGFDHSFSFIYSARPGTPAASLTDNTPLSVKKERLKILQTKIQANSDEIGQAMIDKQEKVLVTGSAKRYFGQLQGRTENNRIVNFSSLDELLIGQIVPIKITQFFPNSLIGQLH